MPFRYALLLPRPTYRSSLGALWLAGEVMRCHCWRSTWHASGGGLSDVPLSFSPSPPPPLSQVIYYFDKFCNQYLKGSVKLPPNTYMPCREWSCRTLASFLSRCASPLSPSCTPPSLMRSPPFISPSLPLPASLPGEHWRSHL